MGDLRHKFPNRHVIWGPALSLQFRLRDVIVIAMLATVLWWLVARLQLTLLGVQMTLLGVKVTQTHVKVIVVI